MGTWGLARGREMTRRATTTMGLMTMGRLGAVSKTRERRGGGRGGVGGVGGERGQGAERDEG